MNATLPVPNLPITLLYDSQCPLCTFGAINLQKSIGKASLRCLDARMDNELLEEATRAGIDLDDGVVIKVDGRLMNRAEAVNYLAPYCTKPNYFTLVYRVLFSYPKPTQVIYPWLKRTRHALLKLRGRPPIANLTSAHAKAYDPKPSAIRKQLGERWEELHPAIQARFAHEPAIGCTVDYRGVMETTKCSPAGKLFAFLTQIVGNPLLPYNGQNVPMEVKWLRHAGHDGVFWERTYHYTGMPAISVVSIKKESRKGEMMECVGGGFGMVLAVYPENCDLHFRSTYYFWQMGRLRIRLPHVLTPGETHVVHRDLGGQFRFTITMSHPWLGRTFYQTGVFQEI